MLRVLFIGGTGVISTASSALAVERGIELYLLNRGQSLRPAPPGARLLHGDIRQPDSVRQALGDLDFDAVVDWIAYTPEQVQVDIELFGERTRQYVFISSAAVYEKPPRSLPVTESTPRANRVWGYAMDKIACERLLEQAYEAHDFPVTIVRPSHTYDATFLPTHGGYTTLRRMIDGKPVVVHGDGSSLWTLTHQRDFAVGLVALLGHPAALGETFHITSDEWLTWNQIYTVLAEAAGGEAKLVHVPSEVIARFDKRWGDSMLGDKMHSAIFDNSKIKRLAPGFKAIIPWWQGAREIAAWYAADPQRQVVDAQFDALVDRIVREMSRVGSPPV